MAAQGGDWEKDAGEEGPAGRRAEAEGMEEGPYWRAVES